MTDRMWRDFGRALATFETDTEQEKRVIESAKASFRCYRAWQFMQNQRDRIARFRRPFRASLASD
jgi:heme oxygenase